MPRPLLSAGREFTFSGVTGRSPEMADQANNAGTMSLKVALKTLSVDPAKVLTAAAAAQRLAKSGPNAIVEKEQRPFAKVVGYSVESNSSFTA